MSGLKMALLALAMVLCASSAAARGGLHQIFAGCVGRFSAEMEHAWLIGDHRARELEHRRAAFISLMEATMPPDAARDLLNHRIAAKVAHAALLSTARFGQDTRLVREATVRARHYRMQCETYLLKG